MTKITYWSSVFILKICCCLFFIFFVLYNVMLYNQIYFVPIVGLRIQFEYVSLGSRQPWMNGMSFYDILYT